MAYMLNAAVVHCPNGGIECGQISAEDIAIAEVDHLVVHGRITDCEGDGVNGAVAKVFYRNSEDELVGISHGFTNCGGYYMINVPRIINGVNIANRPIIVMASASGCYTPESCNEEEDCNVDCPNGEA